MSAYKFILRTIQHTNTALESGNNSAFTGQIVGIVGIWMQCKEQGMRREEYKGQEEEEGSGCVGGSERDVIPLPVITRPSGQSGFFTVQMTFLSPD